MDKKKLLRTRDVKFQTREDSESNAKYIEGYFVDFDSVYEICPGWTETIDPHAFDETLTEESDVRGLINHDTTLVLGRTKAGTLTLKVDDKGLYGKILVNQADQDAMNLYARVQRGDVSQCSFGFYSLEKDIEYSEDEEGYKEHDIQRKVDLQEISVCTFPAYEGTMVEARSKEFAEFRGKQLEHFKKRMLSKLHKNGAGGNR